MKTLRTRITAAILAVLLLGAAIGMYCATAAVYDDNFDYRCTTSGRHLMKLDEFPGLTRERHTFTSNDGQTLVGYLYQQEDPELEEKAVVVFAHGLGAGGQTGFMDIFDYLTAQGYYVFAYDATGNDESEGEVIGGLPQGFIDLDHAIDYAYTIEPIRELPFLLMGYSWGGLSVNNVLNYHPEVKAVVSLAGFNRSMNLLDYHGCREVGNIAKLMLPFAGLYETVKYGGYAFSTAMKGFANSNCKVMIVHGDRDETVPSKYGYWTYYEKYAEDERFTFKLYPEHDHDILDYVDGTRNFELIAEIAAFFDASITE